MLLLVEWASECNRRRRKAALSPAIKARELDLGMHMDFELSCGACLEVVELDNASEHAPYQAEAFTASEHAEHRVDASTCPGRKRRAADWKECLRDEQKIVHFAALQKCLRDELLKVNTVRSLSAALIKVHL